MVDPPVCDFDRKLRAIGIYHERRVALKVHLGLTVLHQVFRVRDTVGPILVHLRTIVGVRDQVAKIVKEASNLSVVRLLGGWCDGLLDLNSVLSEGADFGGSDPAAGAYSGSRLSSRVLSAHYEGVCRYDD